MNKELQNILDNYSGKEHYGFKEAKKELLDLFSSEQLVTFLKWVGDGYDFENNAEKIVKEYIDEGN